MVDVSDMAVSTVSGAGRVTVLSVSEPSTAVRVSTEPDSDIDPADLVFTFVSTALISFSSAEVSAAWQRTLPVPSVTPPMT